MVAAFETMMGLQLEGTLSLTHIDLFVSQLLKNKTKNNRVGEQANIISAGLAIQMPAWAALFPKAALNGGFSTWQILLCMRTLPLFNIMV